MTRLGKIARLPRAVREELGRRLEDGEVGRRLVEWLNGQREVQAVLAAQFGGRPVNEQNLSDWKRGGHEEWRRHQQAREWAVTLAGQAQDMAADAEAVPVADLLANPAALALAALLRETDGLEGAEKRAAILGVVRELVRLRRGDQQAGHLRLESERWAEQQRVAREQERRAAVEREFWAQVCAHHAVLGDKERLPWLGSPPADICACLDASQRLKAAQPLAGPAS
jgi:hypothetical protein